jgi:hypothetical protein
VGQDWTPIDTSGRVLNSLLQLKKFASQP